MDASEREGVKNLYPYRKITLELVCVRSYEQLRENRVRLSPIRSDDRSKFESTHVGSDSNFPYEAISLKNLASCLSEGRGPVRCKPRFHS